MKKYAKSLEDIIVATAEHYDVPAEIITDPDIRTQAVVRARHVAQYLACKLTFLSKRKIADGFNLKDHTAVVYAFNRISTLILDDEKGLKGALETITKESLKGE